MSLILNPAETGRAKVGSGAEIERLALSPRQFDPFITVDHFRMWEATFPPHPHAGFSAVTYLFDDSQTGFRNRDSLGGLHRIEPGGLHWTLAGRGLMHEEIPLEPGRIAHGLQIFVNLPASHKLMEPAMHRVEAAQMPRFALGDGQATLVFGRCGERSAAPLPAPGDASLLELRLAAGGQAELVLEGGQQGVGLAIEGRVEVRPGGPAQAPIRPGAWHAHNPTPSALALSLRAGEAGARLVWLSGTPWREPLVMHGPFGMSDAAGVEAALERFRSGQMGNLRPLPL